MRAAARKSACPRTARPFWPSRHPFQRAARKGVPPAAAAAAAAVPQVQRKRVGVAGNREHACVVRTEGHASDKGDADLLTAHDVQRRRVHDL